MVDLGRRFFQVRCADGQEAPQVAAPAAFPLPRCSVGNCVGARGRLLRDMGVKLAQYVKLSVNKNDAADALRGGAASGDAVCRPEEQGRAGKAVASQDAEAVGQAAHRSIGGQCVEAGVAAEQRQRQSIGRPIMMISCLTRLVWR